MSDVVQYEVRDRIAHVTITNGKANALSPDLVAALRATVAEASTDARALVLAGRPGRFSAGFDLQVMTSSLEGMRALVTAGAELLLDIFTAPIPVVAACTGHALAAGGLLLLACDYRIGADVEAKIGLNEVAIGLTLPIFGVEFARYRCPPTHFDATAVHATIYDPAGAVDAGFLDRVVAVESVAGEAIAKANGRVEAARGLGFTIGPLVGGVLVAGGGTQAALLIDAASCALIALVALAADGLTEGQK